MCPNILQRACRICKPLGPVYMCFFGGAHRSATHRDGINPSLLIRLIEDRPEDAEPELLIGKGVRRNDKGTQVDLGAS